MTVLASTVMTSISVQVTGPVWEPISVVVCPVGTVVHVQSPIARDLAIVSRASRRRVVDGATWDRPVCRATPPAQVTAPARRGSSTIASLLAGASGRCSQHISVLDCEGRYCNKDVGYANKGTCQQCKDVERCYGSSSDMSACRTWNETRCPGGVVTPDYDDPSRRENIVFSEKLHVIKPDDSTMYLCSEYDSLSAQFQLLVAAGRLSLKAGDIVASAQAGGIFHKLNEVTHFSHFTVMRGETATLLDAIQYADFSADTEIVQIDDAASVEQTPSEELYNDVISGDTPLNDGTVVHVVDDVEVYKCLGRTYATSDSTTSTSFHLAVHVGQTSNAVYSVGDVLMSNTSSGFLETVLGVWQMSAGTIVNTTLTGCNNLDMGKLKLSSPVRNRFCVGGDNNPGLLMFDKNTQADLNVGDIVAGRESSAIFAKVLKVRTSESFVILEMANIESVENGSALTLLNVGDITEGRVVRRKRSRHAKLKTLSDSFRKRFSYRVS